MAFSIFRQPVIKRLENNIGTIKMKKYFIVLWKKSGFFVGFICGFQKGIECRPSGKENCLENRGVFLISVYHLACRGKFINRPNVLLLQECWRNHPQSLRKLFV